MKQTDPQPAAFAAEQPSARRVDGAAVSPVFKVAFLLSGAAMALLFSSDGSLLFIGAGVLLALVLCALLAFRFRLAERTLPRVKFLPMGVAAVLTAYICYEYAILFSRSINELIVSFLSASPLSAAAGVIGGVLPALVAVFASFALFLWLWWLVDSAADFFARWLRESDRTERVFLIAAWILLTTAIAIVYRSTTAFYGGAVDYDVVFTADSPQLVNSNAFLYVGAYENDIRQPLFGVFAMPFAAVAMLLDKLLFFVPNAFPIILSAVQVFLLLFGFTLIARMLELRGAEKALFLCLLAASYPALLFSFTVEQYIFAVFWVLLLVYCRHEARRDSTLPFVAAAGSLLTSGVFFPLLLQKDGLRENIRRLLTAAFAFLVFFTLFGRVAMLNSALDKLKDIASFSGGALPFGERLLQYLSFAATCFVRPAAAVDSATFAHVSYQLSPIVSANIAGIAVVVAASAGAVLGFSKKIVRVAACWAAFSFLLLCIVGWGTSENGLVLYTLYFSWAFFVLIYELVARLLSRSRTAKLILLAACLVLFIVVNSAGMLQLIRFAIAYYPAL